MDLPLRAEAPLIEAVKAIEASRRRIAVVIDSDRKVIGTLTDGDVRRCLLAGGTLDTPLSEAMNAHPIVGIAGSSASYLFDMMKRGNVLAIPTVDAQGKFIDVVHITDVAHGEEAPGVAAGFEFAVIMAGGEGARLRPLTESIPKPMIEIAGVPLLERQVRRLADASVSRLYISVNYLSHVIEDYFGDGSKFGVEIQYLREHAKLGTAGALSLLPEDPRSPILVLNGDILTTSDYSSLFAFHMTHEAWVTVAAIDYRVNIPYGVLQSDGPFVTGLLEKPSQRFLCNAGMYAVSPDAVGLIPEGTAFNMTDLIASCLDAQHRVALFPLHEYWSDIGTPDDLRRAQTFFQQHGKHDG